jgi:hypothetical protein
MSVKRTQKNTKLVTNAAKTHDEKTTAPHHFPAIGDCNSIVFHSRNKKAFIKGIYLLNTSRSSSPLPVVISKTPQRLHTALDTIQHTIKQAQEETRRATTIRTPNAIPSDNKRGNSNPAKESPFRLGGTV